MYLSVIFKITFTRTEVINATTTKVITIISRMLHAKLVVLDTKDHFISLQLSLECHVHVLIKFASCDIT